MLETRDPPELNPPLVVTKKSRIFASLIYFAAVVAAGVSASLIELVSVKTIVGTAVVGAAIVYITWSVKTAATDEALSKQDLANLVVYMRRNPARTQVLMNYLMANRIQPWQLTYQDARDMIGKASKIDIQRT